MAERTTAGIDPREGCRFQGCDRDAVRTITFPAFTRTLGDLTYDYCDEHADEILHDGLSFPGARERIAELDALLDQQEKVAVPWGGQIIAEGHNHACCPPDDCCGGPCAAHPCWELTT